MDLREFGNLPNGIQVYIYICNWIGSGVCVLITLDEIKCGAGAAGSWPEAFRNS